MCNFCVRNNKFKKRFELYIISFALLWVQKHKEDVKTLEPQINVFFLWIKLY